MSVEEGGGMRFVEIDGERYEMNYCTECPFLNDGAGEFREYCQHPKRTGDYYIRLVWDEDTPDWCPLREVKE